MNSLAVGRGALALLSAILLAGCALSPQPLTPEFLSANAADKVERVTAGQEPIAGSIDLHEAMARALKYNLDHAVEAQEAALRSAELDLSHFNLLPNLVANSGYAARNLPPASSSYNLVTANQNFGYSTSQDERLRSGDLAFSWHVLDFGLSFIRARQAADKALIAEESRRKVVHRMLEDVRTAYWRAYSAQRLSEHLRRLERRTRAALAGSRQLAADRDTSPLTAITYRRELIEIQRILQELQRELSVAKFQLAALMNVKPGTAFKLAAPRLATTGGVAGDPASLIQMALENRPELRDVAYRQRINSQEAHAALLELLPGLQMFSGRNFDSNSFLLHQHWLSWGAKASWNLLKVFQYPARRNVVEEQDKLLDQRALALTMTVMTQIYVSRVRIAHFERELATATAHRHTQRQLLDTIQAEHAANRVSEQTLLREELNAAVSELRLDIAKASMQSAFANLVASLGIDPLAADIVEKSSVAELASALRGSTLGGVRTAQLGARPAGE